MKTIALNDGRQCFVAIREQKTHTVTLMMPKLRQEIVCLGEFMNPPFSLRRRQGWNPEGYADKLIEKADILVETDENGRIIGLIAGYLNQEELGFISMLVVDPQYRRLGVAELLCCRMHQLAKVRVILRMQGEIRESNRACQMLARKLGYHKLKENNRWELLLDDTLEVPIMGR